MSTPPPSRPVVLTCAQPTGKLHLGNYLGAVANWVRYLDGYDCYFGIVDLHAITVPHVPAELRKATYDTVAAYIACGLDPARCHLFAQSQVVGHTELAWVLGCLCPLGQLERMTQFKDKAARGEAGFVGSGLLFYPVLMAADILLYDADRVPVGEDQRQHLELTRDLAVKFNHTFSETFKVPAVDIPATGARVMALQEPTRKMSKSDPNAANTLFLFDPPATIRKKIRSAVTDSGSEIVSREDKPGVSNLLSIYSAVTGKTVEACEAEFAGQTQYGPFKEAVAEAVVSKLEPIQQRYAEVAANREYLSQVLQEGAAAAQRRANRVLGKVYRKVGFAERQG